MPGDTNGKTDIFRTDMTTMKTTRISTSQSGAQANGVSKTGLMLGMFLAALDQTIVATAIRTIADDLVLPAAWPPRQMITSTSSSAT